MTATHHLPGMELRVEAADGCSLPPGVSIGVRVGDVLKQGRYDPARCFRFPPIDRRRHAKIDVYRHLGSCTVPIDPEVQSAKSEANITSEDPSVSNMKFKVCVAPGAAAAPSVGGKPLQDPRVVNVRNQAKEYLSKHNVENRLSEAVKALLREQPSDPTSFLCNFLKNTDGEACAAVVSLPKKAPSSPTAAVAAVRLAPPAPPVLPFVDYYKKSCKPCCSKAFWGQLYSQFPARAAGPPPPAAPSEAQPAAIESSPSAPTRSAAVSREEASPPLLIATVAPVAVAAPVARVATPTAVSSSSSTKYCHRPSVGTWVARPMPLNQGVPASSLAVVAAAAAPPAAVAAVAVAADSAAPAAPAASPSSLAVVADAVAPPAPPKEVSSVAAQAASATRTSPGGIVAGDGNYDQESAVAGLCDAALSAAPRNLVIASGLAIAAAAAVEGMPVASNGQDPLVAKGLAAAALAVAKTHTEVSVGLLQASISCTKASARERSKY